MNCSQSRSQHIYFQVGVEPWDISLVQKVSVICLNSSTKIHKSKESLRKRLRRHIPQSGAVDDRLEACKCSADLLGDSVVRFMIAGEIEECCRDSSSSGVTS